MDLTESVIPKSDQMNADDLLTGPVTVTITGVTKGSSEQPVDIRLAEFPRPWRPSKSMRRVMIAAWGKEADVYTGRRLTLYRDPSITFGKDQVGGIRISHMSHIDKRLALALTVTRGKRSMYHVELLPDDAPASPAQSEEAVARLADLRAEWKTAEPARRKVIEAEVALLSADPDADYVATVTAQDAETGAES